MGKFSIVSLSVLHHCSSLKSVGEHAEACVSTSGGPLSMFTPETWATRRRVRLAMMPTDASAALQSLPTPQPWQVNEHGEVTDAKTRHGNTLSPAMFEEDALKRDQEDLQRNLKRDQEDPQP